MNSKLELKREEVLRNKDALIDSLRSLANFLEKYNLVTRPLDTASSASGVTFSLVALIGTIPRVSRAAKSIPGPIAIIGTVIDLFFTLYSLGKPIVDKAVIEKKVKNAQEAIDNYDKSYQDYNVYIRSLDECTNMELREKMMIATDVFLLKLDIADNVMPGKIDKSRSGKYLRRVHKGLTMLTAASLVSDFGYLITDAKDIIKGEYLESDEVTTLREIADKLEKSE